MKQWMQLYNKHLLLLNLLHILDIILTHQDHPAWQLQETYAQFKLKYLILHFEIITKDKAHIA